MCIRDSDQAEADPDDHTNLESVVTEQADIEQSASAAIDEYKGLDISEKGKVYDLIVPILVLIFFSILGMMYTGGFFEGVDFATAVGENPVGGLCIGATVEMCIRDRSTNEKARSSCWQAHRIAERARCSLASRWA